MTTTIESLDNLLRALHNAVIKAQELTEQQHLRQLDRYFDEKGVPRHRTIVVPDPSPETESETRDVEVPLLALVPPGAVKISEFEIGFTVRLLGFTADEKKRKRGFQAVPGDPETHSGPIRVDMQADAGDGGATAEVHVRFEGADPPEAFHRILSQLTIGSIQ